MKDMIKYAFILGVICFLASGVLAVVNAVTEPKIQLQQSKEESLALKEVMPEASSFNPESKDGILLYYKAYDASSKLIGFVLKSKGKGYSSEIETITSLNLNLEIGDIKILSQNETPGLGSRVAEAPFRAQFKGKKLDNFNEVQAITGATISSSAVINSIKNKLAELKEQLSREVTNAK